MVRVKKLFTFIMAGVIAFSGISVPTTLKAWATDVPVRENISDTPSSGNIIIGVEGYDYTSAEKELLDQVNAVRKKACDEGDPDPRNKSRKLTSSDYVPIKLGVNCTKAAMLRAAEGSVYLGHTRPNGGSCFQVMNHYNSSSGYGAENLAWGNEKASRLEGWINERDAWVDSSKSGQTGHYESLINPDYKYTGMASFNPINDSIVYGSYKPDWTCTAGQYSSSDTEITSYNSASALKVVQKMEVPINSIQSVEISGSAFLSSGDSGTLVLLSSVFFSGVADNTVADCPVYNGVTWSTTDPSILTIDPSTGVYTAKDLGSVTVRATIGTGSSQKIAERELVIVSSETSITGIENPEMITTETKTAPLLPKTVKAKMSNGKTVDVDVVWDSYDTANLLTHFKSAEFDVTGKALGYDVTQKVHVNPAKINKIYTDPDTITVDATTIPSLPTNVKINLSNGYTWTYNTNWDASYKDYCNIREGGTYTITGKAEPAISTDEGTKNLTFSATLIVNPMSKKSTTVNTDDITVISGIAPVLPKAVVTWADDVETEEDITWVEDEDFKNGYKKSGGYTYSITGSYGGKTYTINVKVVNCLHQNLTTEDPSDDLEDGKSEPEDEGEELEDEETGATYVVIKTKDGTPAVSFDGNSKEESKVVIPSKVEINGTTYKIISVSSEAFKGDTKLTTVKVGDNIETISESAFEDCKNLTTVNLGKNVTTIGDDAFNGCNKLKKVKLPAKVTSIGDDAFRDCKKLTTVTIGAKVTSIGDNAFRGCTSLKKIIIPANVKSLGAYAFAGNNALRTIVIKTKKLTAKTVASKAFKGVSKKVTIKVPKAKLKVYRTLFRKKGLSAKVKIKKN